MRYMPRKRSARFFMVAMAVALAGCAGAPPERIPVAPDTACSAAAAGEALVGNWLSVRRESGVAGELRTLISLRVDGTMNYEEQLSRPRRGPQGLSEAGCWHRQGSTLVLRTLESNGSPVDLDDPIYVNRYQVVRQTGDRITLRTQEGVRLESRRMPPDYRLPL